MDRNRNGLLNIKSKKEKNYEFAVKMRTEKKRYEYQIAKRMANACSSALKQGGMKNIDARIGKILDLHQKNDKELQRKEEAKAKKQKVVSIPAELLGNRYQG